MSAPSVLLLDAKSPIDQPPSLPRTRLVVPAAISGLLGLAYVLVAPAGGDLPAQLLRVKLFAAEGFGIWNNWWYGGHNVAGYSLLFPPVAWLLTPQVVAALAAVATAVMFGALAEREFGSGAWLGAAWFAVGTVTNLLSGRLTYATGLMFALATLLALQSG